MAMPVAVEVCFDSCDSALESARGEKQDDRFRGRESAHRARRVARRRKNIIFFEKKKNLLLNPCVLHFPRVIEHKISRRHRRDVRKKSYFL